MLVMVARLMEVPGGVTAPSSVLPVEKILWADSPERRFTEQTIAAMMVVRGLVLLLNGLAIYLRKRFELK